MARPLINVEDFSYTYRGSAKKALDTVNFSVEEFECCGIIGPSEAGKTTLCYAIASILNHYFSGGRTQGRIFTKGLDALSTPLEVMTRHVAFLLQNPILYLTGVKPTVVEEVAFSMENFGIDRAAILARTSSLLQEMGVSYLAERDPRTLSGGEIQRVALASVLALDPPILILDEPTSSLDHEGIRDLSLILKKLKRKKTILLVENRIEMLLGLVDSILVLRDGKLLFRGKAELFFENPVSVEEQIGAPVWTEVYYQVRKGVREHDQTLPVSYRDTVRRLGGLP
jgi:energy-coupling factor transporter ATP-binding protein EcfA2